MEELVAELCMVMLAMELNVEISIDNSTAYVQSWMRALKGNPEMLAEAVVRAQQACKYVLGNGASNAKVKAKPKAKAKKKEIVKTVKKPVESKAKKKKTGKKKNKPAKKKTETREQYNARVKEWEQLELAS